MVKIDYNEWFKKRLRTFEENVTQDNITAMAVVQYSLLAIVYLLYGIAMLLENRLQ